MRVVRQYGVGVWVQHRNSPIEGENENAVVIWVEADMQDLVAKERNVGRRVQIGKISHAPDLHCVIFGTSHKSRPVVIETDSGYHVTMCIIYRILKERGEFDGIADQHCGQ